VATFFEPLFLGNYYQKFMIVHKTLFFFLVSLFSCVPYVYSQTFMLTMKALKLQAHSLLCLKLQVHSLFHLKLQVHTFCFKLSLFS